MMLLLFWNKSAVKQYVMDWLTISWVMKISMNGCASTKRISMMIQFLTKNFYSKSIWCCQVSASVSFLVGNNEILVTVYFAGSIINSTILFFFSENIMNSSCGNRGNISNSKYVVCKYEELQRMHGYPNPIDCEKFPNRPNQCDECEAILIDCIRNCDVDDAQCASTCNREFAYCESNCV